MQSPLVSVITPCFNSARFIQSCVESVLAQDYPCVEHIVQDGASRDGTVDILRAYDGRVDWVSAPDKSQVEGLDRALKRSRGDILIVLNADDMLLPHAASWAVEQMARYPDDAVIYGDLLLMNEAGKVTQEFFGPDYDFAQIFSVETVIPAQAAFIRRSALERVGIGADLTLETCPDYEMFVRLGLQFSMRHVPGFVAKYRYYYRPMDGAQPRSVERFIHAKSSVIQRTIDAPTTPAEIKKLKRRAIVGLYVWASEESRGIGGLRLAWQYYARALAESSWWGRLIASAIHAGLKIYPRGTARPRFIKQSPSMTRLAYMGSSLIQETPQINWALRIGRRVARFLRAIAVPLFVLLQIVLTLAVLIAIFNLIRFLQK